MNTNNDHIAQVYKKHINSLYRFGMGMGLSHDACLDVIHDVFCRLMEKKMVFETDSIRLYLFRSFINRHIDIQKARKNIIPGDVNDLHFVMEVSLDHTNIEGYMIEKEEKETLKQKVEFLLNLLTERQRKAVYLRYMEEMEYEEIGKLLDMNTESVRKLVFRGLEKIRKYTGKNSAFYLLSVLFEVTI